MAPKIKISSTFLSFYIMQETEIFRKDLVICHLVEVQQKLTDKSIYTAANRWPLIKMIIAVSNKWLILSAFVYPGYLCTCWRMIITQCLEQTNWSIFASFVIRKKERRKKLSRTDQGFSATRNFIFKPTKKKA